MITHDEQWFENNDPLESIESNSISYSSWEEIQQYAREYHEHMIKPEGERVSATIYQAFGCVDPDVLPEGEWERVMDWLSATASGEPAGDLLPVKCTPEYMRKIETMPG